MKFWTVQSSQVIDIIQEKEIYQPSFNKSKYLEIIPDLNDLYSMLLDSFNFINHTNLPGIVFSFAKEENTKITQIYTYEDFKSIIINNQHIIGGLWNVLKKRNNYIIEFNYSNEINPIHIDINDFQFLMPPLTIGYPYTSNSIKRIQKILETGEYSISELPSKIIQSHLPNIHKKDIINIYPISDFD